MLSVSEEPADDCIPILSVILPAAMAESLSEEPVGTDPQALFSLEELDRIVHMEAVARLAPDLQALFYHAELGDYAEVDPALDSFGAIMERVQRAIVYRALRVRAAGVPITDAAQFTVLPAVLAMDVRCAAYARPDGLAGAEEADVSRGVVELTTAGWNMPERYGQVSIHVRYNRAREAPLRDGYPAPNSRLLTMLPPGRRATLPTPTASPLALWDVVRAAAGGPVLSMDTHAHGPSVRPVLVLGVSYS